MQLERDFVCSLIDLRLLLGRSLGRNALLRPLPPPFPQAQSGELLFACSACRASPLFALVIGLLLGLRRSNLLSRAPVRMLA